MAPTSHRIILFSIYFSFLKVQGDDGDGRERTIESGAQGGGVISLSMVLMNSFFNCCWMSGRD